MESIGLSPANLTVTTDQTGLALVDVLVPGKFSGMNGYQDPLPDGRYLSSIDIWSDVGEAGDRAFGFQLVDTDGVIPPPARIAFPSYPIIMNFYDDELVETDTLKAGIILMPSHMVSLRALGSSLNFIPSGLHIVGQIQAATAGSGKIFRCNFIWARAIIQGVAPS